jgi:hypothetical protein
MKIWITTAAAAFLLTAFSAPALAQWPPHPTPNVPRTADGKPDLEGPVPRTADGHPDLSGIWEIYSDSISQRPPPGFPADRQQSDPLPAPPPPPPADPDAPPAATFFDIGANIEGGLPLRPWAKELRDQRVADNQKDNPDAHCLPIGYMQLHGHPQPRKIIQTPDLIVMIYESNGGLRQIFLDGRTLPDNDPQPWWYGYSVGHWDGDTLVVESTGFRDDGWLDVFGSPLTDQGKITERFTRVDYGHMQIDVTIDDPKAYTKPFTVRVKHRIMLDTNLIEFVCNENEKSSHLYDP